MKKIKWYKIRGLRNFLYRIFMIISKLFFIVCGIIVFSVFAFMVLAFVIAVLDNPGLLKGGLNVSSYTKWYLKMDSSASGYMASIVVATITTLLTGITIFQSHYTRRQDRAYSFPKNKVKKVSFGINQVKNVNIAEQYLKVREGKVLFAIKYEDALSSYFRGHPIAVYVKLVSSEQRDLVEKLRVYASNYNNADENTVLWLETSRSMLLPLYSIKTNENVSCELHVSLDVRWTNMLLPVYIRGLSAIYVQENFKLHHKKNKVELLENNYSIKDVNQSYAYLFSLKWICCIMTRLHIYNVDKRRKNDSKRLENI